MTISDGDVSGAGPATTVENAPGGWFDCLVTMVGPAEDGVIYIALRHTGGTFDHWFQAVDVMKRDMLAVALTAISTGLPVIANLTSTVQYATIYRLYVKRV